MRVFVKVNYDAKFSMEVGLSDTVLHIKEKIAKYIGVPVPEQPIFFDGKLLLEEHLNAQQCKIRDNSTLELGFPLPPKPNPKNNQALLHQTEQSSQVFSPQDSTLSHVEQVVYQNDGFLGSQDWSVMASSYNDGQVLHGNEQFQGPSNQFDESSQDSTLINVEQGVFQTERFPVQSNLSDGFVGSQDLSVTESSGNNDQAIHRTEQFQASSNLFDEFWSEIQSSNNDDQALHQTEEWSEQVVYQTERFAVPENLNDGCLGSQDWSVMASSGNKDQVVHRTEQFQASSNLLDEFLDCSAIGNSNNDTEEWSDLESVKEFLESLDSPSRTGEIIHIQDFPGSSNDQMFQTEQSHVPLSSFGGTLFDEEDRVLETEDFTNIQDMPGRSNNQVFQTEQSHVPLNSFGGILFGEEEDWALETEDFTNIQNMPGSSNNQVFQTEQSHVPLNSLVDILFGEEEDRALETEDITNTRNMPGSSNNQVFQTEQSHVPLNSLVDILFGEEDGALETEDITNTRNYWPMKTRENQVFHQAEQSPVVPSNAGKEIINIPDSPVRRRNKIPRQKIRVMILPYIRDDKAKLKFPVFVNPSENVSELRKELVKIQGIQLPEGGYFFMSKHGVVYDENSSFSHNNIEHGDTLETFPGQIINDQRPNRTSF